MHLYMCVYVYIQMYRCVGVCPCEDREQAHLPFSRMPSLSFEMGSLTGLELGYRLDWTSQLDPGAILSLPPLP